MICCTMKQDCNAYRPCCKVPPRFECLEPRRCRLGGKKRAARVGKGSGGCREAEPGRRLGFRVSVFPDQSPGGAVPWWRKGSLSTVLAVLERAAELLSLELSEQLSRERKLWKRCPFLEWLLQQKPHRQQRALLGLRAAVRGAAMTPDARPQSLVEAGRKSTAVQSSLSLGWAGSRTLGRYQAGRKSGK